MNLNRIKGRLTSVQRIALLLASANGREPIRGNTWLQKEIFVYSKSHPELQSELSYEPAQMGPFSESLEWNYDQLINAGLFRRDGSRLVLTKEGSQIASALEKESDKDDLFQISETKELLNDMNEDELFSLVYFIYEDMTTESVKLKDLLPKRKEIAIKLYQKGKVSLGIGAKIGGIGIEDFLSLLRKRGLEIFSE